MAIIIHHDNVHKPENCLHCITHGEIDRDYWNCSIPCPIEEITE